ncbi:methyltransferase domain-containing protein [Helicobacter mehlei]|uniref:Methyltransferase domain-containing protein n=1 Tax=Helicobacter mehlei TaxID=2316080 RepID=A0A553V3H0_9HELI|nr:methyltransferase domain-containing protein [Helicobacter mehlei]TSA87043.1 methyltransferase domain-containing protein [Helicobacter mehlei]
MCGMARHSFNRMAQSYALYSSVQNQIVSRLLAGLAGRFYARVLDLGCGSGNVLQQLPHFKIAVGEFVGLDRSAEMLEQHPKRMEGVGHVRLVCADFEHNTWGTFDLGIACSSLQWAHDLGGVCRHLAQSCQQVALAIHTSASLQEVHAFLGTHSPLRQREEVCNILDQSFKGFVTKMWMENFSQTFSKREEFLDQLKLGGLLGGGLPFSKAKALRCNAPYESLSYEAVFLVGEKR